MADYDPISDGSTPHKRRKLDAGSQGKTWDSPNYSDEGITAEDFETVATLPLASQKRKVQLGYSPARFHSDMTANFATARESQPQRTYNYGGTQILNSNFVTQPTQPLPVKLPSSPNILVDRSSPTQTLGSSPFRAPPAPMSRAPFSKPNARLATSLAPVGTSFRAPLGVQPKTVVSLVDSDDEPDAPVDHSDGETQGLRSNLKPTRFKKGGRGLDSTPNRSDKIVKESPQASNITVPSGGSTHFSQLMAGFEFGAQQSRPSNDMASAYGSTSRAPRPQQKQSGPARALPVLNGVQFQKLDDVTDYSIRRNIEEIQKVMSESVQRCHDALMRCKNNVADAKIWLADTEERLAVASDDELQRDPVRKGVAAPKGQSQSSQPVVRSHAKQQVQVQQKSIAERYTAQQAGRKPSTTIISDDEEEEPAAKPKRRLIKGGRSRPRSPTPPSSPPLKQPQPRQRLQKPKHVIALSDDDEASDSGAGRAESEEVVDEPTVTAFDTRLLKFFNECSVRELVDLSAQPEDVVTFVLDKRPFDSLEAIEAVSKGTKSGKASKARAVGDRLVEKCREMWTGYDAVDELVEECEKIAQPIQKALRGWGASESEGELQLMNLDEAHDSGIGTPASSCPSDDAPSLTSRKNLAKGRFLGQPKNMGDVELKHYQLVGLNWLNLLWSKKISCILADDMGLGKTCQVIAFLAHLQIEAVDGVHLVVVPGSTLENWLREFARFAPGLNVFPYYGSQDERPGLQYRIEQDFNTLDVVVTTYDVAVKPDDNKFLRRTEWAVCVYDEAHQLRNPKSNRYEQLARIAADFKVLLTGTPLQNNLQELVAILAFIMPELFREKREELDYIFQHKASTKDADHAALLSAQRIARARTIMTPFILRRKKAQVLDLPTKHSRVEKCKMTPSQAAYYQSLQQEARHVFSVNTTGKGKAKTGAKEKSNMLMALRQAAIHPLLARRHYTAAKVNKMVVELRKHEWAENTPDMVFAYLTDTANTGQSVKGGDFGLHKFCQGLPYMSRFVMKKNEWMDSGKVHAFRELITAYAANGDRVLVFSQFTTLMDILEAVLETLDIKYMRLDGSTRMDTRQDMIDTYTSDPSIPVFLLSTKAGGAGINLAAANKVIIFDSGYNPQDDVQAENRAHRVGQTREVEVVRLVTRGTIEEQIHALGESKLALDERVAGEGSASAAEEKQADKAGEQMVARMLAEELQEKELGGGDASCAGDLKDAFKAGMEGAGVKVASKQARY